jgi:flagellar motility protein MotE (MotC chaperone)
MTIPEKVRELMLSKKLTIDEKRERLHALIPDDVLKIDDLNKATAAQLRKLQDSIEVAEALQQLDAEAFRKEGKRRPDTRDRPRGVPECGSGLLLALI